MRRSLLVLGILLGPGLGAVTGDPLGSRSNQAGVVTSIEPGVWEVGLESLIVVGYDQQGDATQLHSTLIGGLAVRRFVRQNLALGVELSGFYRRVRPDQSDYGVMAAPALRYSVRLGEGLFLAPGLAAGVLYGVRDVPGAEAGMVDRSTLIGGFGRIGLPLVFYASPRFDIQAGPEILISAGQTRPDQGTPANFLNLDGGFNVGCAYFF